MGQPTYEQVNLMLRLYELRREPKLREARDRILTDFFPQSIEEAKEELTLGSDKNTAFRMAVSYWEMVAGIANRGLIDEELLFESTIEPWIVFEKLRPILGAWRELTKIPTFFGQLEQMCKRLEASREKSAPGALEGLRQRLGLMGKARAAGQAGG
jgi:hypothetical protein